MSGTSLDGLDIALCQFNDQGLPNVVHAQTVPLPLSLYTKLSQLSQHAQANEAHLVAVADREFAMFCADAVTQFLAAHRIAQQQVVAIGSHGQTIRHMPEHAPAYTLQIGCPSTIAARSEIDVIANFRQKDIALGGQGAPLAPAFHHAIFKPQAGAHGVLNIGGIANLTVLPEHGDVIGFDTGPGNCLLDSWFSLHHPHSPAHYDKDGQFAAQGVVLNDCLTSLLADPYFAKQGPKSSGREYFDLNWVHAHLVGNERPCDVQRTLLELSALTIANQLQYYQLTRCYLCGGGVHNPLLVSRITELTAPRCSIESSSQLGVEPDWVEAVAFAWLAWCFKQQRTSSLASVTGATRNAILGGFFPAA